MSRKKDEQEKASNDNIQRYFGLSFSVVQLTSKRVQLLKQHLSTTVSLHSRICFNTHPVNWETLTSERSGWRQGVHHGLSQLEGHLSSRPRQRRSPKTSKIRELDRGQTVFVLSVEGIVTLELAFSATLDAVPRPLFRACCHSLLRLKDAYIRTMKIAKLRKSHC